MSVVILCDTLLRRSKLISLTFESAGPRRFLYIRDASFSCMMLLRLIHFKSFNMGDMVTFVIFPVACHFRSKIGTFMYFVQQFFAAFVDIELQ